MCWLCTLPIIPEGWNYYRMERRDAFQTLKGWHYSFVFWYFGIFLSCVTPSGFRGFCGYCVIIVPSLRDLWLFPLNIITRDIQQITISRYLVHSILINATLRRGMINYPGASPRVFGAADIIKPWKGGIYLFCYASMTSSPNPDFWAVIPSGVEGWRVYDTCISALSFPHA